MDPTTDHKLPLGLCKQAFMKLESFMNDIHEIKEDADISVEHQENFSKMAEMAGIMQAGIINIVREECDEDEFINEEVNMDEIEMFPEKEDVDILDEIIED